MKKKRMKKMTEDALGMGKASLTMGVMGSAVTKAGGNAAGLNTMAGYMPMMGTVMGGGHTLGMLSDLTPKKKKRKK